MKKKKVICFTGHRPDKLKGYTPAENRALLWDLSAAIELSIGEGIEEFITGMALGIDMWAALIVLKLREKYPHIKLTCALPCKGQPNRWRKGDQDTWGRIVEAANAVYLVSNEDYSPKLMQVRNVWMVDRSDMVIAVWDGTPGGTGNCVKYAEKVGKSVVRIDPKNY